ncbi:hypothetical protein DXG01_013313 [Tephrocybe rancida]|nr:hypothetical protein DXG01_013313 [Tephrocybe rancida]
MVTRTNKNGSLLFEPEVTHMSEKLFNMARSKLHVPVGARDSVSLHRWVLLKNSIISSPPIPQSSPISADDDTDESEELDADAFMFPDAGKLVSGPTPDVSTSEAQWLDSLLETLGGDDDDEDFTAESNISIPVEDEDDDQLLISPVGSPISSSDDLTQSASYPLPISVPYPYPVPYPPFHPPLIYPYEFDPESSYDSSDSSLSSLPSPYDEPLPYYDTENSSVPDAIEDTSDDESDAPTTPSLGRSSNSLTLLDAVYSPERSRLRHPHPYVHVEPDDPYFYPFELDPLPFPTEHQPYNTTYQEC